ncbi:anti-sigma factor [Streptomyces sp. NPDC051940]|uniref:anti-sigma factor n=1 Tax=Streptomyces sp. NPDC051940 TaxID=3155675 RepID=UPI00341388B0
MTAADLHTATGAYVLHALPADERARFERHLAACAACAQEVRELAATAARLGLAVSVPVAPELRARVMSRIDTVRQEPPRTAGLPRPRRLAGDAGRFVLAACLAAAAALGGVAVWQHQEAEDARAGARAIEERAARIDAVLGAPDAKAASGAMPDGATGTVVVSRERDRAVFVAAGMPEPPAGKVYQLWFDDSGTMRPAGLLSGSGAVLMDGPVGDASGMGVTVEPAGGSEQPTSAPVGAVRLPV